MYKTPSIRASASPCQGGWRICGLSELFGAMQSHSVSTRLFTRIASAKTEKPYPMTCAYHILCTCLTTTTAAFDRVLRRKRQMGMNQILTEDLRNVNQIVTGQRLQAPCFWLASHSMGVNISQIPALNRRRTACRCFRFVSGQYGGNNSGTASLWMMLSLPWHIESEATKRYEESIHFDRVTGTIQ